MRTNMTSIFRIDSLVRTPLRYLLGQAGERPCAEPPRGL